MATAQKLFQGAPNCTCTRAHSTLLQQEQKPARVLVYRRFVVYSLQRRFFGEVHAALPTTTRATSSDYIDAEAIKSACSFSLRLRLSFHVWSTLDRISLFTMDKRKCSLASTFSPLSLLLSFRAVKRKTARSNSLLPWLRRKRDEMYKEGYCVKKKKRKRATFSKEISIPGRVHLWTQGRALGTRWKQKWKRILRCLRRKEWKSIISNSWYFWQRKESQVFASYQSNQ